MDFKRITINPKQMGGVPCIRNLRIPVATIVGMIANDMTAEEILDAYPDLERDDIREALHYDEVQRTSEGASHSTRMTL